MSRATSPLVIWIENVPTDDDPRWSDDPSRLRTPCPYRRVPIGAKPPEGAVFLRPDCGEGDCGIDREFCSDDVWVKCEDCRARSVPYRPIWDWVARPEAWR